MRSPLCTLVILLLAQNVIAASLTPASVGQFFVRPNETAVLRWRVDGGDLAGRIGYTFRDNWGNPLQSGEATVSGKTVELSVRPGQGFHEVEFPSLRQAFGVVALPARAGVKDDFFAIDSALSWLVRDDALRQGMIQALSRSGIGMSRERLSWARVQPADGQWQWETPQRYETVRKLYAQQGVQVLEMFHDAPAWLGRVGKYPSDLNAAVRAWNEQSRRWRHVWGALEVWNEPDISFGDFLPADQYAALAEAVSYSLAIGRVGRPLVGGAFAHNDRRYLDSAARNGLLDHVDVISFHTYGRAVQMEPLVENYRSWLQTHGHPSMPLWITECGRPWKRGPERPARDDDALSALDITMKGVEARACGIARYFPFVYPYYDENTNNFGMMDRRGVPLRSMAAYVRLVGVLAGKSYLGDLKCGDAAVRRARAFGDGKDTVVVLYTGKPGASVVVQLPLPARRVEGIDGRPLAIVGGKTPVPDGLSYLWIDGKSLPEHLKTDTLAMRLSSMARPSLPCRPEPSAVVLRFQFDPALMAAKSEGYALKEQKTYSRVPVGVRVFNLGKRVQEVALKLVMPGEARLVEGAAVRPLRILPESSAEAVWIADLSSPLGEWGTASLRVTAEGEQAGRVAPRVLELLGEVSLSRIVQRDPGAVVLPIHDLKRWKPGISGNGRMSMENTAEAAWRLHCSFTEGDRWVYPSFRLPESLDTGRFSALALRVRCQKPATVRVFLWEGDRGVGYLTPGPAVAADGQWHTAIVRFSDLTASQVNAPDPNGRLDLKQVHRIAIGMNAQSAENVLDVSDVYFLTQPAAASR